MTEKIKPKVIILESNDIVCKHAESILLNQGWDVTCEKVSRNALHTLAQSKKSLFALFISNFRLPKMEGDDILQKVKSISPLTQRMLLIPANKPDILIKAINKAEINACITSPFNDEDLINHAKNCFKHFKHALKREQLKRVVVHQNKQMVEIAQSLKKKDDAYKFLIDEKKAQKLMLKSKKRSAENNDDLNTNISLSSFMEHKDIKPAPDAFISEFNILCKTIQDMFNQVSTRHNSDPVSNNIGEILKPRKDCDNAAKINKDTPEQDNKNESENSKKEEPDSRQVTTENEHPLLELVENIIKSALTSTINSKAQITDNQLSPVDQAETDEEDDTENTIDDYFEISISESQTKAYITKIKDFDNHSLPGLSDLLDMLREKQISYGILDDDAIETWISKSFVEKIIIAEGEEPVIGHDGKVEFHFKTDFTNPGKISEDGSIDFRERGDIPYVKTGDLLAKKTIPRESRSGISVTGTPIQVQEVIDPVFVAGPGSELSEDELSIRASIEGQPHLDSLGTVSVSPELLIQGDVDFQTGNIDFNGNILVKGTIKEGFTVKGINLTAKVIEGANIELSGDLNVSAGITDSTISTHGNIYAKFINHSNIMGFKDLTVSKEILDSTVMLSGTCLNSAGHIISSQIVAKMGIEAGNIGTSSSTPITLAVGVEKHIEKLQDKVDKALEISVSKSDLLKNEIKTLEELDQELYEKISEKAHIQDRAQIDIQELKKNLSKLEKSNDMAKLQQISNEIKKLNKAARYSEQKLNTIFETQDNIAKKIERIKSQIKLIEGKNKEFVIEKKALKEYSKKNRPRALVTIAKTIIQESTIKGPHSSTIIKEDMSRCKIQELSSAEDGIRFYEMNIADL